MCVTQGGRRRVFETYIHTVSMHYSMHFFHGMASLCMARHTSIWLSSIFLLFLLSLFFPLIHPINPSHPHPIPSTLIQQRLASFRLHLTRLLSSPLPRLSFKFLSTFFFRSNHPSLTLFSLSPLSSSNRQTVVAAIVTAAAAAATLTHAMTSIKS